MKKYSNEINERLTGRHKRSVSLCNVDNKRVLDIGCSYGWFEKFALENNCKEIIAIDPNPDAVAFCKKNYKDKRAKFIVASISNLKDFKPNSFDLIVCFEVLEHIPKNMEIELFKTIRCLLKRGGRLILSTPNKHFFSNLLDPAWYFGHRHYSESNLKRFIKSSRLKSDFFIKAGGFWELSSMVLLYLFKWVFHREIPFKAFFESKREFEYNKDNGMATIFMGATK
ncbi:MAG: methyltransferase domain-containing protein [Candidatus Nanoarchaeia archaeon]|jgi:2-polyprenyl-3-methyl-5-hydroxy-6-metoxy-1,4-benzoquinol methylase